MDSIDLIIKGANGLQSPSNTKAYLPLPLRNKPIYRIFISVTHLVTHWLLKIAAHLSLPGVYLPSDTHSRGIRAEKARAYAQENTSSFGMTNCGSLVLTGFKKCS